MDFDGEVRTADFTEATSNTQIRVCRVNFAIPEREDLPGAEGDTNIAAFAPAFPDDVLVGFLLFAHSPTLVVLSAMYCFGSTLDLFHKSQDETDMVKLRILIFSIPYEAGHVKVLFSIIVANNEI